MCGQWQKHYADLHASIRNGSAPKRFITFDNPENMPGDFPRPGLGDYLIGMVTTFITGALGAGCPLYLSSFLGCDAGVAAHQRYRCLEDCPGKVFRSLQTDFDSDFGSLGCPWFPLAGLLTNRAFVMPESRLTEVIEISRIDWRVRDDVPMAIVKGSSEGMPSANTGDTREVTKCKGEVLNETRGLFPALGRGLLIVLYGYH